VNETASKTATTTSTAPSGSASISAPDANSNPKSNSASTSISETVTDFTRIYNFADGVFSIAVTLLAFDVKLPDLPGDPHGPELASAIWALLPKTLIYAESFLVIGLFWLAHHRMFRSFKGFDLGLMWINNVFLLCVAFLPVPSAIIGRFPGEAVAVRFYCGTLVICALTQSLIWAYAVRDSRLVDPSMPRSVVHMNQSRPLFTALASAIAGVVAGFSPKGALGLLGTYAVLAFPIGYVYRLRLFRREGVRT
jgi:uncharacterized membrane protein